jgi:hypothetical protein
MSTKPRGQEEERNEAKQRRQRAVADLAGARRSSPEPGEERVGDANRQREDRVRVLTERGRE